MLSAVKFANVDAKIRAFALSGQASGRPSSFLVNGAKYSVTAAASSFLQNPSRLISGQCAFVTNSNDPKSSRFCDRFQDVALISADPGTAQVTQNSGETDAVISSDVLPQKIIDVFKPARRYPPAAGTLLLHDLCTEIKGSVPPLYANWAIGMLGKRNWGMQSSRALLIANIFMVNGIPFLTSEVTSLQADMRVTFEKTGYPRVDFPIKSIPPWDRIYQISLDIDRKTEMNEMTSDQVFAGTEPYYLVRTFSFPVVLRFPQTKFGYPLPANREFTHVAVNLPALPEEGDFISSGIEVKLGRSLVDPAEHGFELTVKKKG